MRAQRGQATVEVVALLPVVIVVAAAAFHVLAAGAASQTARAGAHAGAVATLQGRDPAAAARAVAAGAVVRATPTSITVTVRPRTPVAVLRGLLAARATEMLPRVPPARGLAGVRGGDGASSRPGRR